MRKFLASVGNAKLLGKIDGVFQHIADVRTLTESTLSFANNMEEIRAGEGAKLYGRFANSSSLTCALTDAMFNLDYIKYQVGGTVLDNPHAFYNDKKYTSAAPGTTSFELTKVPANIGVACGLNHPMVWIRPMGCDVETEYVAVEANGKMVTLPTDKAGWANEKLCIEYFITRPEARGVLVNANFIPAELVLILTTKLFAGDANAPETGKPLGSVTVKIPRFQLDGQFDLSMAMTSPATMSLNGTALAVDDGGCDGTGVYAEIVEVIDSNNVLTGIKSVHVDDDTVVANAIPGVYAHYSDGHISQLDDTYYAGTNSLLQANGKFRTTDGSGYIVVYDTNKYTVEVDKFFNSSDNGISGISEFSSTTSYAVGELCWNDGAVYKCTNAHTGTWAAGDFALQDDIAGAAKGTVKETGETATGIEYVGEYVTIDA